MKGFVTPKKQKLAHFMLTEQTTKEEDSISILTCGSDSSPEKLKQVFDLCLDVHLFDKEPADCQVAAIMDTLIGRLDGTKL